MKTPKHLRDRTVTLLRNRFQYAYDYHRPYLDMHRKRYDLYRSVRRRRRKFNDLRVGIPFAICESDVARVVDTLAPRGQSPVRFVGRGPEDQPSGRRAGAYIRQNLQADAYYLKLTDLALAKAIHGISVAQVGWDYHEEEFAYRQFVDSPNAGRVLSSVPRVEVVRDRPTLEPFDRLDFFPEPGKYTARTIRWAFRRYYLTHAEVWEKVQLGVFDETEARRLVATVPSATYPADHEDRPGMYRRHGMAELEVPASHKADEIVEILELRGTVPDELVPRNGLQKRIISMGNGSALLRNVDFVDRYPEDCPLGFVIDRAHPNLWELDTPGNLEMIQLMVAATNKLANNQLDVLDDTVQPTMFIDRQAGASVRRQMAAGVRHIYVDGPPQQVVYPYTPDYRGFQNAWTEIEQIWRWIQLATGAGSDTTLGEAISKRQSAREYLGRQAVGGQRHLAEVVRTEEQLVVPAANAMWWLARQLQDVPYLVKHIGMDALRDAATGEAYEPLELRDFDTELDVYAIGSTEILPRGVQQQNILGLLQVAFSSPETLAASDINLPRFMRLSLEAFPPFDRQQNTVMNQTDDERRAQAEALAASRPQGGAGGAGAPAAVGGYGLNGGVDGGNGALGALLSVA